MGSKEDWEKWCLQDCVGRRGGGEGMPMGPTGVSGEK